MKIYDMEQRTPEWFAVRCGVITGSGINRLLNLKTMTYAKAAGDSYINQLLAEKLTGRIVPTYQSPAMARGVELESEALAWYMLQTNRAVDTVGFIKHDELEIGCSPDGIAEDRGVEIKCPLDPNHAGTLRSREVPEKYYPQVQTCMWLTGKKYWDYVSYTDSNMPNIIITVEFDEQWIKKMLEIVLPVHSELNALYLELKDKELV